MMEIICMSGSNVNFVSRFQNQWHGVGTVCIPRIIFIIAICSPFIFSIYPYFGVKDFSGINKACPGKHIQSIRWRYEKSALGVIGISVIVVQSVVNNIDGGIPVHPKIFTDVRIKCNNSTSVTWREKRCNSNYQNYNI